MRLSTLFLAFTLAACGGTTPPATTTTTTVEPTPDLAGDYTSTPDNCTGTPENPTCTSRLELKADGTGSFIGDDIVQDATWTITGDKLTVVVESGPTLELQRDADGSLRDANANAWTRVTPN